MSAVTRRIKLIGAACVAVAALSQHVLRADDATGSAAHGAQLVSTCSGCHGQHGEGLAASGFPRLAGQAAPYLAKQLRDYAGGTRENAVMASFAKALSAQDIADLAAYYSTLSAPQAKPAREDARATTGGRMLANLGDARAGVQGCGNCHGPGGRGEAPLLPYLAGQHAGYLAAQLGAWQQGTRHNDSGEQMAALAKKLSAADIAAVSAYYAMQTPPTPQP